MTAEKTANSIDLFLATNMDTVKLAAYALDEMLTKGRSNEDIQDFLERQSVAKKSVIDPDSTGFYAYINGRFFSGTNWEAPEGYDATIRPWYQKPFENVGEVTVLDPYLDMQTGKRKLALGKVLEDGISVVSIDLPTTEIQQMVISSVNKGDADIAIIISEENVVIAHSDSSEVGRDYDIEVQSLGAMIAKNLEGDEDYYFECNFDGEDYIVYVAYIQSGMRCICVKNATTTFRPLHMMLFGTILVVIFGIFFIFYVLNRSNRLLYFSEALQLDEDTGNSEDYVDWKELRRIANRGRSKILLSTRIQWLVFTVLLVAESLICVASVVQSRSAIKMSVRQRMLDIANCASWSVDGDILKELTAEDQNTLEYRQVYDALAVFRDNVELKYVYAIKDEGDGRFTFTVDPTFGDPAEFGEEVVVTEGLYAASQGIPSVDYEKYTDKWGTFYSAYSPVLDSDGNLAGIVAVDFGEEWFEDQLNRQSQQIVIIYIIILALTITFTWILCYFWIKSITNPLKYMTEVAVRYGEGDFREKIAVESSDEIGVLSHTLQKMSSSLEEQIKKAEEANKAKTTFLANMSHEIRTPINTVLGMNEMILREASEKEILFYAEKIKSAGKNLLDLINDILDFSRIESGKTEIIPVEYDLPMLLLDLANMLETRVGEKKISVNLLFDPTLPRVLIGDETRIRQVITNILTNAAKYTMNGSITFQVSYEKKQDSEQNIALQVSVIDTGVGIRPKDMEKLFIQFERIDEKQNRNIEGTGLGLNITQSLLHLMGSELQVESTYGEGSNFYFTLEQQVKCWEPMGDYKEILREMEENPKQKKTSFLAPQAKILAVDDNDMNLLVFQNLLKRTEVQLDIANSAENCLLCLQEKKYDLVFLDHMMPIKDGVEILQEVRAQGNGINQKTPMVCLTANAIAGARDYYLTVGFDAYLTKPVDAEELESLMVELLPKEKIILQGESVEAVGQKTQQDEREALRPLYGCEKINVEQGLKNNGSVSGYLSIFKMFLEQIQDSSLELERLYRERDFKNYTIKIHAIKSSARLIGAMELGEEAQKLENAGKEEDNSYIEGHLPFFLEEYRGFFEWKSILFDENQQSKSESEDRPQIELEHMQVIYKELEEAANNLDTIRIEEILEEISAYRIPESEQELFHQIQEAVAVFDYNKIVELLENGL